MINSHTTFTAKTEATQQFLDVTDRVVEIVRASAVANGIIAVHSQHTSCCLLIQEESEDTVYGGTELVLQDTLNVLAKIAPPTRHEGQYLHPGPIHIEKAAPLRDDRPECGLNTDGHMELDPEQEYGFVTMYQEILRVVENSDVAVLIEPRNRYESRFLNSVADSKPAVRSAGALTKHVHFADKNLLLPGYGSTGWGAAVVALRSIGFDGVINLECSTTGVPAVTLLATAA